jgi:hypothetical protein
MGLSSQIRIHALLVPTATQRILVSVFLGSFAASPMPVRMFSPARRSPYIIHASQFPGSSSSMNRSGLCVRSATHFFRSSYGQPSITGLFLVRYLCLWERSSAIEPRATYWSHSFRRTHADKRSKTIHHTHCPSMRRNQTFSIFRVSTLVLGHLRNGS